MQSIGKSAQLDAHRYNHFFEIEDGYMEASLLSTHIGLELRTSHRWRCRGPYRTASTAMHQGLYKFIV